MFRTFAVAIGAATLALAPGLAIAQEPVDESAAMLCMYDTLSDVEADLIAQSYLYADLSEAELKQSQDAMGKAQTACAAKHGMSSDYAAVVAELTIYGVSADFLMDELYDLGIDDDVLATIGPIYDKISTDDFDLVADTDWRSNADYNARMKAVLLKSGFPDEPDVIMLALDVIEMNVLADLVSLDMLLMDIGEDDGGGDAGK